MAAKKVIFKDETYTVVHIVNKYSDEIVTLAYARTQYDAPVILAKGKDAKAFIKASRSYDVLIPICHSPSLASHLHYNLNVGDEIYYNLYSLVAEVFASVMNVESSTFSLTPDYHKKSGKTGVIPLPMQLL